MATSVFIDGAHLDKCERDLNLRFDYRKLIEKIVGDDQLVDVFYYNCLPYLNNNSIISEAEQKLYDQRRRKYKMLENLIPNMHVKLGRLACRDDRMTNRRIYMQKGVDTQIAVDMCVALFREPLTRFAVIGGDDDLRPPIELAWKNGMGITMAYGNTPNTKPSFDLLGMADQQVIITNVAKELALN